MVKNPMVARTGLVSVFALLIMLLAGLSVMLPVSADNSPPAIMSQPDTIAWVGHEYDYKVLAIDYEKDPLNYTLFFSPPGMTINRTTGDIKWTPTKADVGTAIVGIAVIDIHGAKAFQNYTIDVMTPPPPMVEIMSPYFGQEVSGTISINGYVFTNFYGGGGIRNATGQNESVKLSLVIYDSNKNSVWTWDTIIKTSGKSPNIEPNFKVDWDSTKVKDGKYFIVGTATDVDGNNGTMEVDFSVHNTHTGEVIWFTSPSDQAMVRGYVMFKGGTAKDLNITLVQVRIDYTYSSGNSGVVLDWTSAYGTTEWSFGYNFTLLSQQGKGGCFAVTARAMIGSNDQGDAKITVCTDNVIPPPPPPAELKVFFATPSDGAMVKGDVSIAYGAYSSVRAELKTTLKIVDSSGKDVQDLSFIGTSNGNDKVVWNTSWGSAKVPDGTYYLGATVDADNGASGFANIKVYVTNVAPPPPPPAGDFKVWIDYPADGVVVSDVVNIVFGAAPNWDGNITGAVEISNTAGQATNYNFKGIANQNMKVTWTQTWDTTQMDDGFTTVLVKVTNTNGKQVSSAKVNVWINNGIITNPPPPMNNVSITFTYPANGQTVSGKVTVTGKTYYMAKIMGVRIGIYLDGKAYTTVASNGGGWSDFSFVLDTTSLKDGQHGLNATITVGGISAIATTNFNVKNTGVPPPVPPPKVPGGQKNQDGSINVEDKDVKFQAPDYSGMDKNKMNYTWNFGDGTTSHDKNPEHKYSGVGNYTVTLTATDGTTQKESALNLKVGPGPAYKTSVPGFGASALVLGLIVGCVAAFFRRRK